ncbi:RecB family nuclease, putative, TM0106 family [Belliella baltica DSM 15883]|uniref:RecB family nuclease, putative, TM0106 family n=1 Tax=Belliella baltica (strain DSM 15883 / CIP 108006 / LMG 21964 / BA134) TaxID=866536 RepID=I3Z397_BELBD|nr:TM0106 family RecB-like putative nuclease [Belliella baltica]AFL83715.1 RecB family nuclease, putative, TM0106 family [Belliella baltica DSM 15883]
MKRQNQDFIYSPSDLSNFIHCKHLTTLDKLALDGGLEKPVYTNKVMLALREKGEAFEKDILAKFQEEGKNIYSIEPGDYQAFEKTRHAMQQGYDIIYQARVGKENEWQGWADFLIKVEESSDLGNFSYQVMDTKLASETKAATIIQISLYTEAVAILQGKVPELMWVKTPDGDISYRTDDFMAYVRLVKKRFLEAVNLEESNTYPEPVMHCDICTWWEVCNKKRRDDDHLGFVAGMGSTQIKEVKNQGIETLQEFAELTSPIPFQPNKGAKQTYQKLRDQANIQYRSRNENYRPIYELLELEEQKGFFRLPEPSEHDIYLDLEGDPLVEPGGLEYMIGWYYLGEYQALWAKDQVEEKHIFEQFMSLAITIKAAHPEMHIYHYAPYEVTAFKRLMGKYVTFEEEMDQLLRSETFVDLYGVVKQGVRASVEKYSIKDLEKFFGYEREIDLREVSKHKSMYEFLLETNKTDEATPEMLEAIRLYNQDDCISTHRLHVWLESLRQEWIDFGVEILRPEPKAMDASEKITEHQLRIKPIYDALMADMPVNQEERTSQQQGKYILANMLDWYRREKKSFWWEFFRLLDLSEEELLEEKNALSMLRFTGNREPVKRSVIDSYRFEYQETDIRAGKKVKNMDGKNLGEVVSIDMRTRTVRIKKGPSNSDLHPSAILMLEDFPSEVKEEAIISLAIWVMENGIDSKDTPYKAARMLLLRQKPDSDFQANNDGDLLQTATHWAAALNHSYLPIQGPPGSGKSYTASRMILELIKQGKKIGVTALSHKVITNLLEKVWEHADDSNFPILISQKIDIEDGILPWFTSNTNEVIESKISSSNIIAGTSFMWAKTMFEGAVDYLFVDEAGQLSLIDTLAVAQSAKNLILLGDPQQLQQPQQGVHPEGTEVSALAHILQEQQTIRPEQGVFLDKTWRMHPDICTFDSEQFYENKLFPIEGLEHQAITGNTAYSGSGLRFITTLHEGNTNSSEEEVMAISAIVEDLCKGDVTYINAKGEAKTIDSSDIKIISPYNAQVSKLKGAMPEIEIGTVDKFQGQEAPIVIYSVATSSPQDAPRGMDFLYSPHRFNVAVSRARALFILVASPLILEPDCKSPSQIKLANPFCRFVEMV